MTPNFAAVDQAQKRYFELWEQAERDVKVSEQVESKLLIPSINELRYAGYHHIQALKAGDDATRLDELGKAQKHCQRASYDALELVVVYHLERIKKFRDDYRMVEITPVISDYQAHCRVVREVSDFLGSVQKDSREAHYREIRGQIKRIQETADALEDARPELNKALIAASKRRFSGRITLAVAIAGVIVGALASPLFSGWVAGLLSRPPQESGPPAGEKGPAPMHGMSAPLPAPPSGSPALRP